MKDYEKSISEAQVYLEMAEKRLSSGEQPYNPVAVNCIMSIIKSVDGLMLRYRGKVNKDHSKTAKELQKLYEDTLVPEKFSSNTRSVRKWVVDEKTEIQYRSKKLSKAETQKAVKSARRLLEKSKRQLEQ